MSLTLSVTSSTTLFATNIAANATSLTFASSLDGTTYSDISTVTIPVGTTAYSLTIQLIPSYYYRVTVDGSSSVVQYILQTKGPAGPKGPRGAAGAAGPAGATGTTPTAVNWRLNLSNVTTTTLTSPAISTSTYGTYYYITNSGFSGVTLPAITSATDTGAFWVLRNNTTSYLSAALSGTITGLISPIVIPPSNAVTIVWTGTGYVLF